MQLFKLSTVSISFSKEDSDRYYICSGIIKDDRKYEAKIVYKKRLESTDQGPLQMSCNCMGHKEYGYCEHAMALYLTYHYHIIRDRNLKNYIHFDENSPPLPMASGHGVSVEKYGSIIDGPHRLAGAPSVSTYSSLQYLLHQRKVVNFPVPRSFEGTLILNIDTSSSVQPDQGMTINNLTVSFQWRSESGVLETRISIFENLYLFHWDSGQALHLNSDLQDLVQKIRIHRFNFSINDYIRLARLYGGSKNCEIIIDGKRLEDLPLMQSHCHIHLKPDPDKKGMIDFELFFVDDEDQHQIIISEYLGLFTFTGGALGSFRKKRDAYDFLQNYIDHIENDSQEYKKYLQASSKRDRFFEMIAHTHQSSETLTYNKIKKSLNLFDSHFQILLIKTCYESFGETFFRMGRINDDHTTLHYKLSSTLLFQGISKLFTTLLPYGVSIFYDQNEIKKWASRVRFERRSSFNEWFDVEIKLSQDDLEILKNTDLDSQIVLSKDGPVFLGQDHLTLLRYLRQYLKNSTKSITNSDPNPDEKQGELVPMDHTTSFLVRFNRARIFEIFELKKLGIEGILTPEEEELCQRLSTFEEMPQYELPQNLVNIVRPYQKIGYNWLRFLYENKLGACLADDMGLGKTLQTIAFIKSIYHKIERVIVICPVTILINWQKEIEKFSDMEHLIYHGGVRQLPKESKIILTSYGVMKKEVQSTFKDLHFDVMILDEVQHLKNIRSQGAFAARQLNADFRICLTGTPVENDLSEFYNILDLAMPGLWGDIQSLKAISNTQSRKIARNMAAPFILRRTKSQVLSDLPPKIENNVYLEMMPEERQVYEERLRLIQAKIQISPSKNRYGEILKGLLELRQSCLWQKNENLLVSTKIDFLMETLEQVIEEGHQAIVFSQFTTYLNILQTGIHKMHWKYSRIDGSQTTSRRQKEVDQFQSAQTQIFLISLKAGGVGLNLTAASYVFVMDPWWNPAVENQAIDRAHRIGQKNTLNVYRPIIKDSVEEKVLKLQEMKKELFDDLLNTDDNKIFNGRLTMKDFEQLLS